MKNVRLLLLIVIIALRAGNALAMSAQPQGEDCHYFDEVGYHVCGEFLTFYKAHGGLEIFGYPLTNEFYDRPLRLQVQYFQRARLELHPRASGGYEVLRSPLLEELGHRLASMPTVQITPFNDDFHLYFPETGHVVSYAFLDYFRDKGGLETFGYPRSEFMLENGYFVQYFDWARMEWHPEITSGPQIRLTNWGEIYIERLGFPEQYGKKRTSPVTDLRVTASVRRAIIGEGEEQVIYVYVTDRWWRPVENATVGVTVYYGAYECEATDANGFTMSKFNVPELPPGRKVVVDVAVSCGDQEGATQISFLPWW